MIIPYPCPDCGKEIKGKYTLNSTSATCSECSKESKIPFEGIVSGMTLGNGYRIEKKLDDQSQAKHYLAYQESMDRKVTLKVLPPEYGEDEEEFKRFQREIKLAAALNHPHILSAFGAGQDAGISFLIRQYKEGQTFEEYCLKNERMEERKLLKCLIPIADALNKAWTEEKILHRNLKPENILLGDDGSAMLADLGIAKSMKVDADITTAGFTVGTPEYMSPEQVQGKQDLDCRSDIYSFCLLLYRMLTGEVPFADPSPLMVMQKQMNDVPTPAQFKNKDVSTNCSTLIDKGLKKKPEERFQDWDEFLAALKATLKGDTGSKAAAKGGAAKQSMTQSAKRKHRPKHKPPAKESSDDAQAAPASGGGVRREDVERIAQQMYAAKAQRSKTLLYIMATVIPLLLAGILK
jgi:serine/threonine-protein kinase